MPVQNTLYVSAGQERSHDGLFLTKFASCSKARFPCRVTLGTSPLPHVWKRAAFPFA